MNRFLAVDTASAHLTALAVNGDKVAERFIENCALKQSVMLMDEVNSAMDEAALRPSDCDFFCAVTGPGSFTGIRIGISAAKGFALACGKPLMPLTSFELVAYNVTSGDFFCRGGRGARAFLCLPLHGRRSLRTCIYFARTALFIWFARIRF